MKELKKYRHFNDTKEKVSKGTQESVIKMVFSNQWLNVDYEKSVFGNHIKSQNPTSHKVTN
jgi:hypothetical protein